MRTIGSAILGLTIQCAQCHNHKYDPLKQEEYYRMMAFINQTHEADVAVYTPQEEMKRTEIVRRTRELEGTLQRKTHDWQQRMAEWEQSVRPNQPEWTVVNPEVDAISTGGERYLPMKDHSFLALGYAPTRHKVKMTVKTDIRNITAFRLELLTDPELPRGGPGRSAMGACALSEFEVEAAPANDPTKIAKISFARATADVNVPEGLLPVLHPEKEKKPRISGPVAFAIDGKEETAWMVDGGPGARNQPRKAVFTAATPIDNDGGTILTFYLMQNHAGAASDLDDNNNLGRMRLSITSVKDATADPLPAAVREILAIPSEQRRPEQTATVFSYWRTTVRNWKKTNKEIAALWDDYPEGSSQLVLTAQAARETHVLTRGDFLKPAKVVTPGVPAYLNPLPAGVRPDRLAFAKWMVDRSSPTTARALMNRFWQEYFGTGIVSTSEDLGTQADTPSHPELLDWMAVEFMDNG